MASVFQTIKFYYKSTVFGILIAVCALYGVVASIFLRIIGKPEYSQYTVARAFYYSFSTILGVKINLKNEKYLHDKPAVFISNHQSALDILILGRIFQPGFTVTAKKVLQFVPFLGWFMLASGTFFIDRAKSDKARKTLQDALNKIKGNKRGIFLFPEGTRSGATKPEMLPFKKGAFHLAQQAKIPVVPIVVSNYSNIFHSASKTFNTGEITIDVLPPVQTKDVETKDEIDELVMQTRTRMMERLKDISIKEPAKKVEKKTSVEEIQVEVEETTEETPLVDQK